MTVYTLLRPDMQMMISPTLSWRGGRGSCAVAGEFGDMLCQLEASPDFGNHWLPLGEAVRFNQDGVGNFDIAGPVKLRLTCQGSAMPQLWGWVIS